MSFLSDIFGGGDAEQINVDIPDYYRDEYYDVTQEALSGLGLDIVGGNITGYFAPIGEWGGAEFEKMLGMGKRDIQRSGLETAARMGIRGARAAASTAGAVADYETANRYADYARAIKGREFLLGTGIDTLSGVRSGALTQSQMKNAYGLNTAQLEAGIQGQNIALQNQADAAAGQAISSVLGTAANIYTGSALASAISGLGSASKYSMPYPMPAIDL